mmetsp:Transcript_27108/g.65973  ORF Transcript_27108/g.65973 Transcript_27108/m.65973 type:complete len:255 (-) Transcript_27108:1517-2281(-)
MDRWQHDSYLRERVGDASVRVNVWNETRGFGFKSISWWTTFPEFLDVYSSKRHWRTIQSPSLSHSLTPGVLSHQSSWPPGELSFYLNLQNLTADPDQGFVYKYLSGDFQVPWFSTWLFLDQVNFWMGGPRDVTSQLHYDGGINLLAQISGTKRFLLLPPSAAPYLYLNFSSPTPNFSPIDIESPDVDRYPEYAKVSKPIECLVEPGDVLHVPAKWFHQVHSSGRNVAVNFWFLYPSRFRVLWMSLVSKLGYQVA